VEDLDQIVFRVDRIVVQGADDVPAADLAALYANVRGADIIFAALRRIADDAQTYFRRKGFTFARVVVPEQRIEAGVVTLRVIRGYAPGAVKLVDERLRVGFVRIEARYDSLADHTRAIARQRSR